ncbi:hypothetical protein [Streptomyces sp. NBC_01264]|uniref:hypothetical protein n=1 Tax=Streptomyces sp. NBC_01264 TaxID=2903804 RepID=UPI002254C936|nr:hypothetical protein [Streptomyces sp. NBC_01264]MCX4783176.1 hypothetical protein [Streptomyces sp. NBC_01264]
MIGLGGPTGGVQFSSGVWGGAGGGVGPRLGFCGTDEARGFFPGVREVPFPGAGREAPAAGAALVAAEEGLGPFVGDPVGAGVPAGGGVPEGRGVPDGSAAAVVAGTAAGFRAGPPPEQPPASKLPTNRAVTAEETLPTALMTCPFLRVHDQRGRS